MLSALVLPEADSARALAANTLGAHPEWAADLPTAAVIEVLVNAPPPENPFDAAPDTASRALLAAALERIEQAGHRLRFDDRAEVVDRQHRAVAVAAGGEGDGPRGVPVMPRVAEQIRHHLRDPIGIAFGVAALLGVGDDGGSRVRRHHLFDDLAAEGGEVDLDP